MSQQQSQLATLCYISEGNKTLMMHRIKKENDVHTGKWNGLGGKFLPGETPETCVKREIKEECGLILESPRLRGVLTFPDFTPNKDWTVFLFTATQFSGELSASDEGELKWIETSTLHDLNLWEGDRIFLEWLQQPHFFSGYFQYENKKLISHHVTFYPVSESSKVVGFKQSPA